MRWGMSAVRIQASVLATIFLVLCLGCATQRTQVRLIKPDHDAPTYRRLLSQAKKVEQVMNFPHAGFKYGLLDMKSANAMIDVKQNALFVTKDLMNLLSDKELDCVLAHEWGHVMHGHYGKKQNVSTGMAAISSVATILSPVGILSLFVEPVATNTFSRSQEEEADREAARILNDHLKISPYACVSALEKLGQYKDRNGGRKGGGMLDSHPSLDARIIKLKAAWPDPPRVYQLTRILVRTPEEVRVVLQRLREGEIFQDLVPMFSVDPLITFNNGELGRFQEWELEPEVARVIGKFKGEGIAVFRYPEGFHIVKAVEIQHRLLHSAEKTGPEMSFNGRQ